MEEEQTALVVDNGSDMIKAGHSGDDNPRAVFHTLVGGHPRSRLDPSGKVGGDYYVGDEAYWKAGILKLLRPIEDGIVTSWHYMESIWQHAFSNGLRACPDEHPVLLTDKPTNPKANREKMTQMMFEAFSVPAMSVQMDAALALYASGRTTGVTLDVGQSVTHAVPVLEGRVLSKAVQRLRVGGQDLEDRLRVLLYHWSQYDCQASGEVRELRAMKEKVAYVALECKAEAEMAKTTPTMTTEYELPDGRTLRLDKHRFYCAEVLFDPRPPSFALPSTLHIGCEAEIGVHRLAHDAITKCEGGLHRRLYSNIVLCGGTSALRGMADRVQAEVAKLSPYPSMRRLLTLKGLSAAHGGAFRELGYLRRHVASFRPWTASTDCRCLKGEKYSAWVGGSILSSLSSFRSEWVTKEEFEDVGPSIVHRHKSVASKHDPGVPKAAKKAHSSAAAAAAAASPVAQPAAASTLPATEGPGELLIFVTGANLVSVGGRTVPFFELSAKHASASDSAFTQRRFSNFKELRTQLAKVSKSQKIPKLPMRSTFMGRHKTEAAMKETADKLQEFMQALADVPALAQHPALLAFVGMMD